jgi:hypothetical protein
MSKGLKQWIENGYKNSKPVTDEELINIFFKPRTYEYQFFLGVKEMKRIEEIFKEELKNKYGTKIERKKYIRQIN